MARGSFVGVKCVLVWIFLHISHDGSLTRYGGMILSKLTAFRSGQMLLRMQGGVIYTLSTVFGSF